jgi:MFS family permease
MPTPPLPPDEPHAPVPARAWTLLWLMTAFNVLNFVDRQLIYSLAPLLMADLSLSRAQIGLLVGFAFVVFYTLVGMVMGVAADRWPRRGLIGGGLVLWSAMTAVSGAARGFMGLAVPRVLMGVGEAMLTPAALSMLGHVFPQRRLGLATGVYYAGLPIGTALSLIVAGWMAPRFGWRACFYVMGAAGILAAGLLALVREPERPARPGGAAGGASVGAIVADLRATLAARPSFGLIVLGGALLAYGSAAALHGVTWLVQERGFAFAQATFLSGAMAVTAGFAGNLAGGWFADWCQRRWRGGRAWSLVLMTVGFAPFGAGFVLLPVSSPLFYVAWFVSVASTVAYFGPVFAAIQDYTPAHIRSSAVALGLLAMNIIGVGPGSWITGVIGDRASLSAGLLVSVGVTLAAAAPFALAARLAHVNRAVRAPSA